MVITGTGGPKREEQSHDDLLGEGKKATLPEPLILTSAVNVPTVFADTVIFAYDFGPTVRMQFVETIAEAADGPNPGLKTRHVGNLVLPTNGFRHMMAYLNGVLAKMDNKDGE